MRRHHVFAVAFGVASSLAGLPTAAAAETGGSGDPFGTGDPFAVIGGGQTPAEDKPVREARRLEARSELFLKGYAADVNNSSRVNPGNRYQLLDTRSALAEMRLTASDTFDERKSLRWLFKGYASQSSERAADGTLRSEVRVDELFTDWKGESLFASLGKRRVNWGHAQGFNPVNVVAPPRDPLNPSYQTEGRPMLWLSGGGAPGTADVILTRNYDRNWSSDTNRWGLKWGYSGGKGDYALYYFDGEPYPDGREYERMLGASFSVEATAGMTVYLEAARFAENNRNYYAPDLASFRKHGGYTQAVIGSLFDLGNKSSLFIEYFHNGQGDTRDERRNYLQAADQRLAGSYDAAFAADFVAFGMNRNYLLAGYRKEYREKWNFSLSVLGAEDRSTSTRTELTYALSDYYELRSSYVYNTGNRDSEFGNNPYHGLFEVGIKASF